MFVTIVIFLRGVRKNKRNYFKIRIIQRRREYSFGFSKKWMQIG